MHRFYMVQSFTRFHRNVSVYVTWSLVYSSWYLCLINWWTTFCFPSTGRFSCRTFPRCKSRGAAPEAGTCYQGGPCMPQSSGSSTRCTQWCKCWAVVKIACNCALSSLELTEWGIVFIPTIIWLKGTIVSSGEFVKIDIGFFIWLNM